MGDHTVIIVSRKRPRIAQDSFGNEAVSHKTNKEETVDCQQDMGKYRAEKCVGREGGGFI
jgi:hypothetical protein